VSSNKKRKIYSKEFKEEAIRLEKKMALPASRWNETLESAIELYQN
jgi:hypothetical protein